MTTTLSRIQSQDQAAWSDLWRDYLAFYDTTRPPALYARNFAQLVQGDGPLYGWLARDAEGVAVGLAHYFVHGTAWSFGDACYLQDLYVHPARRGGGIASALIAQVAADAKRRGCERLYWLTHVDNARARALYDRVAAFEGFICYERGLD